MRQEQKRTGMWKAVPGIIGAILLTGCGGAKKPAVTGGRVAVPVTWATRAEEIGLPPTANSVTIRIQNTSGFEDFRTINRPTGSNANGQLVAEFFGLPAGQATITATAYVGANGTGATLGPPITTRVNLSQSQTTNVSLAFNIGGGEVIVPGNRIPADANAIVVTFRTSATPSTKVAEQLILRPFGENEVRAMVDVLPAGVLSVEARAFSSEATARNYKDNGTILPTDAPQAFATTSVTIVAGRTTPIPMTLNATIASVRFSPENIPLTRTPVTLTAQALDAAGNRVLTRRWRWENSNPAVLSLDASRGTQAVVAGITAGQTELRLTETESNQTFARNFTVVQELLD